MDAVVLETDVLGPATQSKYDDSLASYQFPSQYRSQFDPLYANLDMLAIVYEPRGESRRGRMSYVGWAIIRGEPVEEANAEGRFFRIKFREPIRSFEKPVPKEIRGEPIERWLRAYPRGRRRNVATLGRAVRHLAAEEADEILRYGTKDVEWDVEEPTGEDPLTPNAEDSRVRRTVTRLERDNQFRQEVLDAYERRCAISGLSAAGIDGLLDAAHIRGAGSPDFGPDHITNGIALTPTLHRLFDRHLFSLQYRAENLVVVTSNRLNAKMVRDSETGCALKLHHGQSVRIPKDTTLRPGRQFVNYHRRSLLL